jgi:hypothetical protein
VLLHKLRIKRSLRERRRIKREGARKIKHPERGRGARSPKLSPW